MTPVGFDEKAEILAAEAARAARHPAVPGVYGCIVRVSAELAKAGIAKDSRNVQQGYAFRGIDAVMNALAPILSKHGLVILPRCLSRSVAEHPSKTGGTLFYVTVEAEFDFVCAADGSTHTVRMYGEAMDSADKATNKAMSAAYKYAAFQTFCIPTEGDDADATTPELATDSTAQPYVATPHGLKNDAPDGYAYLDRAWHEGSWYHAQIGKHELKTKLEKIGVKALQAHQAGVPVKLLSKKPPYLDDVIVYQTADGEASF